METKFNQKLDEKFFNEAFKNNTVPQDIKKASISICRAYGINGICDPVYISNVIALSLGLGDGKSN
ncbi:MAG: hypothetical protein KAS32_24595, partial [Candidatus Peribacteraceae bacterium]|nr:hypothetical protein [Candidatus Peribacteraceae bacterium]